MDITYEWLQEIVVHTKLGNILRLHLSELSGKYRLYGEFFDVKQKMWSSVSFSSNRVSDPNALLEGCLKDLKKAIAKRKDEITRIENPCNDPYITGAQQQAIATSLGLLANVSIN